jgi:hypothetical protein
VINLYSEFGYSTAFRWWLACVLICCAATFTHAQETTETKSVVEDTLTGTEQTAQYMSFDSILDKIGQDAANRSE